jgi:hypothetical protein
MFTTSDNGQTACNEGNAGRGRFARIVSVFLPVAIVLALTLPAAANADFGVEPGSLRVEARNSDGSADVRAGTHPYEFVVHFALNTEASGLTEGGEMRDAIVDLPPGLIGNPSAIPSCPRQDLEAVVPHCPGDTQIGVLRATEANLGEPLSAVYNLTPPPGTASRLGFSLFGANVLQDVSVDSEEDYRVEVGTFDVPIEVAEVTDTIWGVPPEPGHDAERECYYPNASGKKSVVGCSSEASSGTYLTLPTSCAAPLETKLEIDSTLAPGSFHEYTALSSDGTGNPVTQTNCNAVPFSPTLTAQPTTQTASSSSGLNFELKLPNEGLTNPAGVAETEPEKTEVILPQGATVNPSAASGLGACTPAQYHASNGEPGVGCPESSKIGTLVAKTPLLEEAIEGSVYLAAPHDNPFGSLLALYIVAKASERGVLIKQAGLVQADPVTGQLTTTFDGLPPLPYSSFQFDLREGPRAPLITPQTCGTYTTHVKLYPFSNPSVATERSANFNIGSGANGSGCASNEAQLPNAPILQAGTVTPVAGAFSPFVFKISREDGTQRLGAITATLPEGMLGKLAGVPYCSEAQIAAATARSNEGEGATEQSSPSCPENSQVGVVNITAGAGAQPYAVQGKAYLAGPYKNAPLSLAIITPAVAGPFDLGTVVVRVALYIDQNTAQIHAISDPLPTILDGIPLDIRSVSLEMNRAGFTFNPTSCESMSVTGVAISTLNQTAGLSNRFQVGGCQGLPFKPTMTIATQGKTSKANGASLTVKLSQKPGEANIHKVNLTLPTILPARLTTLQQACTEAQFDANPAGCPAGSFIGTAKAVTPVLSVPLTGPAILVSHGGAAFPDVVFLLQANERGADIRIDLDGKTDIKKGVTYSRFETVPDAPIASFETNLPQGPHSVLAATGNLCTSKLSIPTALTGQNGAQVNQNTPVTVTGCPKTKVLTRAQKLALALKACHKKHGAKRQACERTARKKYGPLKKAKKAQRKG